MVKQLYPPYNHDQVKNDENKIVSKLFHEILSWLFFLTWLDKLDKPLWLKHFKAALGVTGGIWRRHWEEDENRDGRSHRSLCNSPDIIPKTPREEREKRREAWADYLSASWWMLSPVQTWCVWVGEARWQGPVTSEQTPEMRSDCYNSSCLSEEL